MEREPTAADSLATFRRLLAPEGQQLLAGLPPYDAADVLAVTAAARRAGYDEALVAAALSQSRLRARAVAKFGAAAASLYFTADGLEQATRPVVAARRTRRYAEAGVRLVADLCCGVGGDLPALVAGCPGGALAVDRDPLACAVVEANLQVLSLRDRVEVRCAEAQAVPLDGVDAVFVDPARRGSRGRTFDPAGYSPPYSFVLELAGRVPATGAKLAPGIPHAVLPSGAEAEWVSVGGDVVECALWCGPLATDTPRRATLLPSGATLTGDGRARGAVGAVGRFLWEPDGAVIRAGLVAEMAAGVQGRLVDPTIANVTGDRPTTTPFGTAYEVHDVLPFGLKRLRALLRSRGVGRVTIKKRGSAIVPETLRRQLRLTGDAEATVVVTRVAGEPTVLLVERL
jgi:hypothetical protein